MSKANERALAILENAQIGSNFQFERRTTEAVRAELAQIAKDETATALRGIRLGIALYRVKKVLTRGKWMPWVKQAFKGYSHKTATDYMRVARYFVATTKADLPEVLALANTQVEMALGDGGPDRALVKKALKFVGEKTLTELIAEAAKAFAETRGSDDTTPPPAPAANIFAEQAEHVRLLKATLHDPNALLQLTRKQRSELKDDLWSLYDGYVKLQEQAFGNTKS